MSVKLGARLSLFTTSKSNKLYLEPAAYRHRWGMPVIHGSLIDCIVKEHRHWHFDTLGEYFTTSLYPEQILPLPIAHVFMHHGARATWGLPGELRPANSVLAEYCIELYGSMIQCSPALKTYVQCNIVQVSFWYCNSSYSKVLSATIKASVIYSTTSFAT